MTPAEAINQASHGARSPMRRFDAWVAAAAVMGAAIFHSGAIGGQMSGIRRELEAIRDSISLVVVDLEAAEEEQEDLRSRLSSVEGRIGTIEKTIDRRGP